MPGELPPALDLQALAALGADAALIARRRRLDGERALEFLAELPDLVAFWQERLGLRDARIMPGGVLSVALRCTRSSDGRELVLKLSSPSAASPEAEAEALRAWGGEGACALEWASADARAMLLELILPGEAVRPGDAVGDARRAGALLTTLHRVDPAPEAIPDAADELRWRFERAHEQLDGPSYAGELITHERIDAAHEAASALHRDAPRRLMLHGDFIAKNLLLDAERGWRAIDPRPCVGDPCMDAAFWALAWRPGVEVRERCVLVAEAAALDAERVWAWARAFAVSEAVLVTDAERAHAHHSVSLESE